MNIDKIVKLHATKLRIDHLTGNLSEMECITFLNNFLEAINNKSSCENLKDDFEIGEQVLLTTRTVVTIDTFCEDGMIGIDDNNEYYKVGKDELTKRV